MAPVPVDPARVREFADADAFYDWLSKHHDREGELSIKIHKVASGLPSITPKEMRARGETIYPQEAR